MLWAVTVTVFAGAATPGYCHVSQYVSELGEKGAVHGRLVSFAGFLPLGVLVLGFLGAVRPFLPARRRTTAGLVGLSGVGFGFVAAAVARCDPGCSFFGSASQNLHTLAGLFHYGGSIAGLFLLASAFRASSRWRPLARFTLLAGTFATVGMVGMVFAEPLRGLFQRVAEVAFFGWATVVCVRVGKGGE
jgi:hypothetical protein